MLNRMHQCRVSLAHGVEQRGAWIEVDVCTRVGVHVVVGNAGCRCRPSVDGRRERRHQPLPERTSHIRPDPERAGGTHSWLGSMPYWPSHDGRAASLTMHLNGELKGGRLILFRNVLDGLRTRSRRATSGRCPWRPVQDQSSSRSTSESPSSLRSETSSLILLKSRNAKSHLRILRWNPRRKALLLSRYTSSRRWSDPTSPTPRSSTTAGTLSSHRGNSVMTTKYNTRVRICFQECVS